MNPVASFGAGMVFAVAIATALAHLTDPLAPPADPCQHPHVAAPGVPCKPPLELYGVGQVVICRCASVADTITPDPDWKTPDVI